MKYDVEVTEECGGSETLVVEADSREDARTLAEAACRQWVSEGEYGDEGASVSAWYTLEGDDPEHITVEFETDHDALIAAAGGSPDCEHDWTAEGEGGCVENPGVWSTGGTSMSFATHCRLCGLHCLEISLGSQHNPGDHDRATYRQPAQWCVECQSDDCDCEPTP